MAVVWPLHLVIGVLVLLAAAMQAGAYVPRLHLTALRMSASMDMDRLEQCIKQPLSFRVADAVVGGLFAIDPLFNAISKKARNSIKGRADSLGFSWDGLVDDLKRHTEELEKEFELRKDGRFIYISWVLGEFRWARSRTKLTFSCIVLSYI